MGHSDDSAALLSEIAAIARAAGAAIMSVYQREFEVELKADESPLTEADRAAHEIIVAALRSSEGAYPVLSEEAAPEDSVNRSDWQRYWLVDPLDGTKEFIKRNGEFTVNIALIDNHIPVLGVVYAPALDRLYSGIADVGAWLDIEGQGNREIRAAAKAADPVRVVGSRSHASPQLAAYLERLGPHRIKPMGSSLKICLVAAGEADVYPRFGPTSEWDTAAAHAVLNAAGGSIIDVEGRPLRYNEKEHLLNPHFLAFGDRDRDWLNFI